ncbi:hypothetical protein D3C85_1393640 [compost metagenome]
MLVRPEPKETIMVNWANKSNTIDFVSIPKLMVRPDTSETIETAGMVRPIVASADPKAKFKLVCNLFFRAALYAAKPSGSKTTAAITTPTKDFGAPAATIAFSISGASALANSTTTPKQTNRSKPLDKATFLVGGSAWTCTLSLSTGGKKKSRCLTVCTKIKVP